MLNVCALLLRNVKRKRTSAVPGKNQHARLVFRRRLTAAQNQLCEVLAFRAEKEGPVGRALQKWKKNKQETCDLFSWR